MFTRLLFFFLLSASLLQANQKKEQIHFSSLSGNSIKECVSFYKLYPYSSHLPEVEKMLGRLLVKSCGKSSIELRKIRKIAAWMGRLQEFFSGLEESDLPLFTDEEEASLLPLFSSFSNRKLTGFGDTDLRKLRSLKGDQVDIATAFCTCFSPEKQNTLTIVLDFLAVQALEKVDPKASLGKKAEAINELLFFDLGYRFAPMTDYEKNIDSYSLLSSVVHSRRGVCMGTSLLWGAIAQRLGMPVEFVVPPGHIFPRVPLEDGSYLNIETTARGIHIPLEEYSSISANPIHFYGPKGAVALLHQNVGAKHLSDKNPTLAKEHFQSSLELLEANTLALEGLAYSLYLEGSLDLAKEAYASLRKHKSPIQSFQELFLEQMLTYSVDPDTVYFLFLQDAHSSLEKQKQLEKAHTTLKRHPEYTSLNYLIAMQSLALHQQREGCASLEKYVHHHPFDPHALYTLTVLEAERFEYAKAKNVWQKLTNLPLPHCRDAIEKVQWELDLLSPF